MTADVGLVALGEISSPSWARADAATTTALVALHLIAATVMIPTLARSLRNR